MKKSVKFARLIACAFLGLSLLLTTACGGKNGGGGGGGSTSTPSEPRDTVETPVVTEATGAVVYQDGPCIMDASNTADGYIMINYTGGSDKVQIQITNPNGETYPYPLGLGDFKAFPLTGGNGTYSVTALENVSGDLYSVCFSKSFDVNITDEFRPYLFPNQYVGYTADSQVVALGKELSRQSSTDLGFVENVYNYTISHIDYDKELASHAPVNYIPNPDSTLSSGTGICFDYASVMSSMLRSQHIPTKLVVGYSGEAYHAWISVYLEEQGWVDNIIEFNGTTWSLMDPTLGASNNSSAVAQYIGDGSNYTAKYTY